MGSADARAVCILLRPSDWRRRAERRLRSDEQAHGWSIDLLSEIVWPTRAFTVNFGSREQRDLTGGARCVRRARGNYLGADARRPRRAAAPGARAARFVCPRGSLERGARPNTGLQHIGSNAPPEAESRTTRRRGLRAPLLDARRPFAGGGRGRGACFGRRVNTGVAQEGADGARQRRVPSAGAREGAPRTWGSRPRGGSFGGRRCCFKRGAAFIRDGRRWWRRLIRRRGPTGGVVVRRGRHAASNRGRGVRGRV